MKGRNQLPAKKAARQSVKRQQRNQSIRRTTRTRISNALQAFRSEDIEASEPALRQAISALDKSVKKGVMHKNSASRKKARLTARLNKVGAGAA